MFAHNIIEKGEIPVQINLEVGYFDVIKDVRAQLLLGYGSA
jgi:hypothetical protein